MNPPTVDYAGLSGRLIGSIKSFKWGDLTKEQLFDNLARLEAQYDAECKVVNDYYNAKLGPLETP